MRQIQKLIDKIMSRSFHEYQMSQEAGRREPPHEKEFDDSPDEDLGALQGIV